MSRVTVEFSGTVQGVGFRYTASRVAQQYDVTGYVRNCADGTVELVAEGTRDELDAFISSVQGAMSGCISDSRSSYSQATGEYARFDIRL